MNKTIFSIILILFLMLSFLHNSVAYQLNNKSNNTTTYSVKLPVVSQKLQVSLLVVILSLAILFNGSVILNITKDSLKLKMVHFLLIRHVCITDLLGASFVLPVPIVAIAKGSWEFGDGVCSIVSTSTAALWTMHLVAVALYRADRVFAVWLPTGKYPIFTCKQIHALLVLVWLVAISSCYSATIFFGHTFQPALALCIPNVPLAFFVLVFSGYCTGLLALTTGYALAFAIKRNHKIKKKKKILLITEELHSSEIAAAQPSSPAANGPPPPPPSSMAPPPPPSSIKLFRKSTSLSSLGTNPSAAAASSNDSSNLMMSSASSSSNTTCNNKTQSCCDIPRLASPPPLPRHSKSLQIFIPNNNNNNTKKKRHQHFRLLFKPKSIRKSPDASRRAIASYAVSLGHLLLYLPAMFVIGLKGGTLPPGVALICGLVVYCEFLVQPIALLVVSPRLRNEVRKTLKKIVS